MKLLAMNVDFQMLSIFFRFRVTCANQNMT